MEATRETPIFALMNHAPVHSLTITKAGLPQLDGLVAISTQTFRETFARHNTEDNMQLYLDTYLNKAKLQTEMEHPGTTFYLATLSGTLVGYLKINRGQAQTELQDDKALEIERIYVLHEYQGKKIGLALLNKAIELAKAEQLDYVWLGVWEKNTKAIGFYQRFGFAVFDKHAFVLGTDVQTDWMMKLLIRP